MHTTSNCAVRRPFGDKRQTDLCRRRHGSVDVAFGRQSIDQGVAARHPDDAGAQRPHGVVDRQRRIAVDPQRPPVYGQRVNVDGATGLTPRGDRLGEVRIGQRAAPARIDQHVFDAIAQCGGATSRKIDAVRLQDGVERVFRLLCARPNMDLEAADAAQGHGVVTVGETQVAEVDGPHRQLAVPVDSRAGAPLGQGYVHAIFDTPEPVGELGRGIGHRDEVAQRPGLGNQQHPIGLPAPGHGGLAAGNGEPLNVRLQPVWKTTDLEASVGDLRPRPALRRHPVFNRALGTGTQHEPVGRIAAGGDHQRHRQEKDTHGAPFRMGAANVL